MPNKFCFGNQINLRELITQLQSLDPNLPVYLDILGVPSLNLISYRGYYEDICISPTSRGTAPTVGALKNALEDAVGETYTGYKGGEYRMSGETPVWISDYGSASGVGAVGTEEDESKVILKTELVDE